MFAAKLLTHMMVACLGTQVRKKSEVSKYKLGKSLLSFLSVPWPCVSKPSPPLLYPLLSDSLTAAFQKRKLF